MSQDFFILSNKTKTWIVHSEKENVCVWELKNPFFSKLDIEAPPIPAFEIFECGTRKPIGFSLGRQEPIKINLELYVQPKDYAVSWGDKKDIQPQDFYSMKEIIKLSKIINAKLKKKKKAN
jgi:hypothetical protein